MVLKSPPNTCRIRLLLEVFPNAKFVHIHRDPYVVYQSTMHLMVCALKIHSFQKPNLADLHPWVIRQYQTMYEVFFEERDLIPAGRHCEVSFEKLDADPVGQMRRVYEVLDLPDFGVVAAATGKYVRSLAGYSRNWFPDLTADVRSEISRMWQRCFAEWGYPT